MKPFKLLIPILVLGSTLSVSAADKAPSAAIDRITLLYMNHKIYPKGSVECEPRVLGNRSIVGCWNFTLNGKSAPQIWLYDAGKFKPVNGSARQLADTKFSSEPDVAVMKLPLPADIDVGAAVASFK